MSHHPDADRLVEGNYGFIFDLEPRFSDMDAQRHLNNVAIAQYYEEARTRL